MRNQPPTSRTQNKSNTRIKALLIKSPGADGTSGCKMRGIPRYREINTQNTPAVHVSQGLMPGKIFNVCNR